MRKVIVLVAATGAVLALAAAVLVLFVYTRDFGVNYKGRVRMHYNWEYWLTSCPKKEFLYDGKYFSFSYPKFADKNPITETLNADGGLVFAYRIDIRWYKRAGKSISSELSGYLARPEGNIPVLPSAVFMNWLTGYEKHASVYVEKLKLRDGSAAILLSGGGKEHRYLPGLETNPYHKYIYVIGSATDGVVFKAYIHAPLDMPEEVYRERVFGPHYTGVLYPSAENEAKGACVFDRFLKTLEIKQ